jgi:hypothetical protein
MSQSFSVPADSYGEEMTIQRQTRGRKNLEEITPAIVHRPLKNHGTGTLVY